MQNYLTVVFVSILFYVYGGIQVKPDTTHKVSADTLGAQKKVLDDKYSEGSKPRLTPGVPTKFDWLKLLSGDEIEVEVRRISDKYVFYSPPGEMELTESIDRRKVQTIYYRNGAVEQMSRRSADIREFKDWRAIQVTRDTEDVKGLIKLDDLEVRSEATTRQHYRSAQALEKTAEISIKKQAATLDADIVLIIRVNHTRSYGESPAVVMVGEAYKAR